MPHWPTGASSITLAGDGRACRGADSLALVVNALGIGAAGIRAGPRLAPSPRPLSKRRWSSLPTV